MRRPGWTGPRPCPARARAASSCGEDGSGACGSDDMMARLPQPACIDNREAHNHQKGQLRDRHPALRRGDARGAMMSSTDASVSSPPDKGPLVLLSTTLASWLASVNASPALTTYQSGRLFFLGRKPDGGILAHERLIE